MPIIEGIGDEVVIFAGVVLLLLGLLLAWFSTSVSEQPFIRAILVIERRSTVSGIGDQVTIQNNESSPSEIPNPPENSQNEPRIKPSTEYAGITSGSNQTNEENGSGGSSDVTNVLNESLSLPCVSSGRDSQVNDWSHHSLPAQVSSDLDSHSIGSEGPNFQTRAASVGEAHTGFESSQLRLRHASTCPVPESINTTETGSAKISDERGPKTTNESQVLSHFQEKFKAQSTGAQQSNTTPGSTATGEHTLPDPVDGTIRIRLKYLNDTQRLVEGRLAEPLGDFKRRYFEQDLESNKMVRLIFNGQLLRSDQESLQFYGLFDNCVVHCQISSNIGPTPVMQSDAYPELDLSRFMLPLFAIILGAIWYCRIQYRQFFNATSTFALLGITGLFLVSVVAMFIPRRDPVTPVTRQTTWVNSSVSIGQSGNLNNTSRTH